MQEFHHSNCDPKLLSPGTLAFLGDAVYELFVRQQLVETANMPVNKLHLLFYRRFIHRQLFGVFVVQVTHYVAKRCTAT